MWPYHPELLATPVPRYTSFPTAAEFGEDVGQQDLAEALEQVSGDVSLYVHIPFCEKICWYCGCNTSAANRTQRVASYIDALHREIALVGGHLPNSARVTRIAFGGGSPNAISPVDLVRLVDTLTVQFGATAPELSIELDPRTMTADWAAVIAAVGFARASLGVQTLEPRLQKAIGRIQPVESIRMSVDLLRGALVRSLNFDLMYGLPGQTMEDIQASLEETVALGADRIAVFGYAHVPHMIARQRKIDGSNLPDQEARFRMAEFAYGFLVSEGYEPVGFDHFAKPDDLLARSARDGSLRRNFQGFTDDGSETLIGLGASAISSFPGLHAQNEKNTGRYQMMISQNRLTATRGIARSHDDRKRGALIEALLCQGRAATGMELLRAAEPGLRRFFQAGLCSVEHGELVIAPEGLPYARAIAAQFDPYRQDSLRRFSSAV